jgi:hypothetical protein
VEPWLLFGIDAFPADPVVWGALKAAIEQAFGGLDTLKKRFVDEGAAHFASGWVWLTAGAGGLEVISTHDADDTFTKEAEFPLLVSTSGNMPNTWTIRTTACHFWTAGSTSWATGISPGGSSRPRRIARQRISIPSKVVFTPRSARPRGYCGPLRGFQRPSQVTLPYLGALAVTRI